MQPHQQIFFVIGLVVTVPVLIFYYRRAGHRRFRPRVGEMVMVSLFAVLLCGAGALLMGSFLDDPDQYRVGGDLSVAPGPGAGEVNVEGGENEDGSRKSERRASRDRDGARDRGSRDDGRETSRGAKERRD